MKEPVRVLQVLGRSAGGIARHVAQVTTALDGSGGLAIDIAGPSDLPFPMPKEIHVLQIPDGVRGHGPAIRAVRSIVRDGRHDVVHAHGLRAGIDAARAARRLSVPVIVTVHNLVRPEVAGALKARLFSWTEALLLRLATRVLAVSEDIAARLRSASPGRADKVEVLLLGIEPPSLTGRDRASIRAHLGLGSDEAFIVTAARLQRQKAIDIMLEAVSRLEGAATLAIFGEGPLEAELRALAGQLGLTERVRFMGWRADIADFIAAADVFCLSSVWEGVPLAAQEAIALGVPVVATQVGGMAELIEDRASGRLVPSGDAVALARALEDTLRSPEKRSLYARNARLHLQERFSTTRMLERLREIYVVGETS